MAYTGQGTPQWVASALPRSLQKQRDLLSLSTILGVARHVLHKEADRKLPTPAAKVAGATTRQQTHLCTGGGHIASLLPLLFLIGIRTWGEWGKRSDSAIGAGRGEVCGESRRLLGGREREDEVTILHLLQRGLSVTLAFVVDDLPIVAELSEIDASEVIRGSR